MINEKDIIRSFADWKGIELTATQLKRLLERHPRIKNCIEEEGFDTVNRDRLGDALAFELTNLEWPLGMDGPEAGDKFLQNYCREAQKVGYKVLWEHYL